MSGAGQIAIDIGGTKIAAARVIGGAIRERRQIATPREDVAAALVPAIAGMIGDWLPGAAAERSALRLGVATTGFAQAGRITAINPATLPFPDRFDLGGALQASLGLRAVIVNDALAAAWGEFCEGAGRGAAGFTFLTISTGIGGGSVIGGRLHAGSTGFAGHVGHLVVDRSGPTCGCGRRGCVEAIASGTSLASRASAAFGETIDAAELFRRAEAGDAMARDIVGDGAAAVAVLCLNLKTALDVERIAIGGSVGLNPAFIPAVRAEIAAAPAAFRVEVTPASLGGDAGLIGAAALAMMGEEDV